MAVITLPLKSPREEESTPSSRMLISADHHRPAGNLSPTGTRANSLPVRVPYALQRRFTWPPRAATPEDHASYQEDYFMAKSLGMYNRLLAAGLNVQSPATVDEVLPEAVDDSVDDETAGILFTIDDCTTALDFQHPHEGESIPLPRMSLSENHHHHPAANSSPVVGAESISMPVRVPCASQRRCTWPPSASVSDEHWANQENYFMAKSFKMYNRLLAAGLNVKSPAVADEVLPESAVESADDEAAGILFPIDDVISALEFQ